MGVFTKWNSLSKNVPTTDNSEMTSFQSKVPQTVSTKEAVNDRIVNDFGVRSQQELKDRPVKKSFSIAKESKTVVSSNRLETSISNAKFQGSVNKAWSRTKNVSILYSNRKSDYDDMKDSKGWTDNRKKETSWLNRRNNEAS